MASRAWQRLKRWWCCCCCTTRGNQDNDDDDDDVYHRRGHGHETDPLGGDDDDPDPFAAIEWRDSGPPPGYIDQLVLQTLARIRTLVDK